MKRVVVIGGGAAGLMAAVSAAEHGAAVTILEKMATVGRKLLITGKGRCNVTNIADIPALIKNIPGNGSFLYSSFHLFNNREMISFLAEQGVETKVERGGRVFPVSDKARDVVQAFLQALARAEVVIKTSQTVTEILVQEGRIYGVVTVDQQIHKCDAAILATGGSSYPGTGSSGDGYVMAKKVGHTVVPLKPSLVPLEVSEEWIQELQGLSLKNVTATLMFKGKRLEAEFGEMLFTHYGLSGPIILSLSKKVSELLLKNEDNEVLLEIDLKPALSEEKLDSRIMRDFEKFSRRQIGNSLHELLPSKLIPVIIDLAFLDPEKPVNQISKVERQRLLQQLKHLTFTITATRPISEAIVTAGGISVKEINPGTMASKVVQGLYLAGEVIDIDGYTGGFNLQAAFSTGYVAGRSAAT
ncbi:hypothetical protein P22_2321 [Propionispora sp. 2/2-37]|uniref:NAD(P)/FAD-dependent oxidoreductase n=1 Tax=Propionispora sp. 2/2-37 TaxID=1677858 RepID=UPI0006BB7D4C|nr:NAD(P)/FAD-dependent oxidoreductase [Propionispora sp. 2/2-37]CUH96232.1 hypothetical protein P22_2321 [Propionispora sp. 2/2-37]